MKSNAVYGWVLYDDSCGFCSRWVPFWSGALSRRGLGIAPLQADWVRSRLSLSDAEIVQDLLLLFRDGRLIRGADVYRYVMQRVWWAYPLFLLSTAPVGRRMFDFGYRTFARNRFRVSRACGLRGRRGSSPRA
jgi:predicted DCC family thiol-disulfide oxidoreductase YuxK